MKIICIGRNYVDHIQELNNAIPEEPVIFMKPDTALLQNNAPFYHPDFSTDIHYEVEVIYRVCKEGKYIAPEFALNYVDKVGLGIDFTARDLQQKLKEKGLPWEKAKAFNGSAVISEWWPLSEVGDIENLEFSLEVNGDLRQQGNTKMMIHALPEIIAHVSTFFTLKIGDVLFTGTPKGVGKVNIGDSLEGFLKGKSLFKFQVK